MKVAPDSTADRLSQQGSLFNEWMGGGEECQHCQRHFPMEVSGDTEIFNGQLKRHYIPSFNCFSGLLISSFRCINKEDLGDAERQRCVGAFMRKIIVFKSGKRAINHIKSKHCRGEKGKLKNCYKRSPLHLICLLANGNVWPVV